MALSKYDIELDAARQPGTSHSFLLDMVGSNKRVLDVGCDTGYLGEALTALGNKVWGFEISEETAAIARERMIDCAVGDLEKRELTEVFEPRSFEVVIFGDVLEHLRDPLPVLRAARGLLSPGGSVLVSTPNVAHGDVRLALLKGQFRYNKLGILDETHTRFFTAESLVTFAHDAGFVVADLRRTRADLFSTEIGVNAADYDPALIAQLAADPEATTYQFVVRLVPDDSSVVSSAQALAIDGLRATIEAMRAEQQGVLDQLAGAHQEIVRLQERVQEVQDAHDEAVRQREELRAQIRPPAGERARRLVDKARSSLVGGPDSAG
jgi:2-polyprenyl-3-methyl-5-hydroxy-6-metoxy-1,4-benzoquinol methylase